MTALVEKDESVKLVVKEEQKKSMVNKIFRKYEKECIHLVRIKIADLNDILASVDAGMKIVDRYEHFDQAYNQYVRNAMIDGNPPVGFEMYMDKYGFEDCAVELEDATQNAFEILSRVLGIKCVDYKWDEYNGNYVNVKYRV